MSRDQSRHIVVCGAGIIGLCCARELRARGHAVTVVDRAPANRDGCSFGNAGMITPSHFVPLAAPGMVALGLKWMFDPKSPFYIRPRLDADLATWGWRFLRASTAAHVERAAPVLRDLNLASRELYAGLAAELKDFGLVTRGLLMLCREARTLDHEGAFAAQANALGVPAEVLDAAATARLDPGVRLNVAGSIYFPKDAHLDPARLIASLTPRLEAAGVKYLWNMEITGWRREGSRLAAALTSRGELAADEFVLAGGAWSPAMVRGLELRLPMQAG
ncbi:MAG: FAD-dependent oxidoreductase, partial [Opitutaceae bacterium]